MDKSELQRILMQKLSHWSRAGVTHLPLASASATHALTFGPEADSRSPVTNRVSNVSGTTDNASTAVRAENIVREEGSTTQPSISGSTYSSDKPALTQPSRVAERPTYSSSSFASGIVDVRPYPDSLDSGVRQHELKVLSQQVAACQRCAVLSACRTQTVFGVGNPQPRLVFFGEAPGADEDQQGEPFVGAAGQLLNKIIEACQMQRSDVYILNTVKCRPPGNRNPNPDEQENCWEYAERQLEILQPEFICCLGRIAAQRLLKTESAIGRLRGQFFTYRGSQVIVTYHPAYLLRTPSAKKATWDDMKMLMAKMGIELPST